MAPGSTLIGVDTQASLQSVLEQATANHEIDAVVASGDIAHDAQAAVYERFEATVRQFTAVPLLCLPGNHDVLGAMHQANLPMQPLQLGAWTVVSLDSHIDDTVQAEVTQEDMDVTAQAMATAQGENLLLATHHPMVDVDCPWIDKDRIQNVPVLLESLCESSAVAARGISLRAAIFGHAHQIIDEMHKDWPLLGCPSTCFQFLPQSPKFALDDKSPGYRVLQLFDDGSFTSDVERTNFPIDTRRPAR